MQRISILPKEVVERIAAGEVIDRPASVVKELIENSIDAKADRIVVQFSEGGIKEIMVRDNGIGMSREDAIIAFKRHATSKIKTILDLERITTLGFRGEALASIAAVSKVEMITRSEEDSIGTRIIIEGGEIKKVESVGASYGTVIYVRDLFYNTPARRKFLKDKALETSEIIEVVRRYAIGYPNIHFILRNESKEILNSPKSSEIANIAYVLGTDIAKDMIRVEGSDESMKVEGYISRPDRTFGNKNYMYIFVNGRYVKNESLYNAVLAGYRGLLFRRRFPYCILRISLSPNSIDVNIHPSKIFVRFMEEEKIYRLIERCVWDSLRSTQLNICSNLTSVLNSATTSSSSTVVQSKFINKTLPLEFSRTRESETEKQEASREESRFPHLEILGQIEDTYIVAKSAGYLVIIDQHAAHERIRYEKLLNAVKKKESQNLVSPKILEFTPTEVHEILEYLDVLEKVGFKIEEFGKNTLAIRGIPPILECDVENFLKELLAELRSKKFIRKDELLNEIVKDIACKGAIKANEALTELRMRDIITELKKCENPFTCPHGRPTMIFLSKENIEKMFKRT